MPMFGSRTILAKDIIGWAQELAAVEEARLTLNTLGRVYYNMAIAEIYNIIGYIDVEALMQRQLLTIGSPTGKYFGLSLLTAGAAEQTSGTLTVGNRYRINDWITADNFLNVGAPSNADGIEFTAIGTTPTTWTASSKLQQVPLYNYDKIVGLEVTNGAAGTLVNLQAFPLPLNEFLSHKANFSAGAPAGAKHPYDESLVYTIADLTLHLLWGSTITIATPAAYIYYTRQLSILNLANFETAYMEVPDKYAPLLAQRIAAFAEMRQGINDKSMAVVQASYQNLLAPLDAQVRSKIMDSFQFRPSYTPNERPAN